jgi:hypothetical protein
MPTEDPRRGWRLVARVLAWLAVVAAVLVGAALVLVAATVGSCGAFGGRCPAPRPPLAEDDTFGLAAIGGALMVAVPWFLSRPSWLRLVQALVAGVVAGGVIGLVVRSAAYG